MNVNQCLCHFLLIAKKASNCPHCYFIASLMILNHFMQFGSYQTLKKGHFNQLVTHEISPFIEFSPDETHFILVSEWIHTVFQKYYFVKHDPLIGRALSARSISGSCLTKHESAQNFRLVIVM